MLVIAACVVALLSPLLRGRSLAPLARVDLRGIWLVWMALVVQIVVTAAAVPEGPAAVLHLGTYLLAAAFVVLNWRIPGVPIVAVGGLLNGVTIALNGGTLPASASALRRAGFDPDEEGFVNSGVVDAPVLPWLGDVFAWPEPLPFANVFSVGDIVVVLGVAYGAHRLSTPRRARSATTAQPPQEVPADGLEGRREGASEWHGSPAPGQRGTGDRQRE